MEAGRTIVIVEGEKDVGSLTRLAERTGGACATTAAGGADAPLDDLFEAFRGANAVIVSDCDNPGRTRRPVAAGRFRVGAFAELDESRDDGFDVSDLLGERWAHSRDLGVLRAEIEGVIRRAVEVHREGNTTPGGRIELRPLSAVAPRRVEWLLPGLIPLRTLTLVAGIGGPARAPTSQGSRRRSLAEICSAGGGDVIIVSYQDTAAEILRPRVEAAGGDLGACTNSVYPTLRRR